VVVLQCYIGGNPFCSDHSQRCWHVTTHCNCLSYETRWP
jgi:hypothetical protein